MENEPEQSDRTQHHPDEALPCIWMTAGLVSYKLCDMEFECERCSFDTSIRGGKQVTEQLEGSSISSKWEFRSDRYYDRFHGWIQQLDGAEIRYGLDVFAGRMLSHASSIVLPSIQTKLYKGRLACWILDGTEVVPLRSPVTGNVSQLNLEVQQNPSLISSSSYDRGWLLEISCDEAIESHQGLLSAEQVEENTATQLKELHIIALKNLPDHNEVGATLADGGEPLADLRQILGTRRYYDTIIRLLG